MFTQNTIAPVTPDTLFKKSFQVGKGGEVEIQVSKPPIWRAIDRASAHLKITPSLEVNGTAQVVPMLVQGLDLGELNQFREILEGALAALGSEDTFLAVPAGVTQVKSSQEGKVWRLVDDKPEEPEVVRPDQEERFFENRAKTIEMRDAAIARRETGLAVQLQNILIKLEESYVRF